MSYTKFEVQGSDVSEVGGSLPISGMDSTGKRWLIYKKSYNGPSGVAVYPFIINSDDGITWENDTLIFPGKNNPGSISLFIDNNDDVHIVCAKSSSIENVDYRKYSSSGETWGDIETVISNSSVSWAQVICDSSNTPYVVYHAWSGVVNNLAIRKRNAGPDWSTDTWSILDNDYNIRYPASAFDSNDYIHITAQGFDNNGGFGIPGDGLYEIVYVFFDTDTEVFGNVTEISYGQQTYCQNPTIKIDSDDNIHTVWSQIGVGVNDTIKQIVYRKNDGSWNDHVYLTDSTYDRSYPSLAIDDYDKVYVVYFGQYLDPENSCDNIICDKFDGNNWRSQTLLTEESVAYQYPMLSKTNCGFDCYVYTSDGGSYNELYGVYTGWNFPSVLNINFTLKSFSKKITKNFNVLNIIFNLKKFVPRIQRYLHGRNAFIKVNNNKVRNLSEWILVNSAILVDATPFNKTWAKKESKNKNWVATLSGFFDPDDTTGQKVLEDAYFAQTKITNIKFYMRGNLYYTPDTVTDCDAGCFISSIETNRETSGIVKVTINIEGCGEFKRVDS